SSMRNQLPVAALLIALAGCATPGSGPDAPMTSVRNHCPDDGPGPAVQGDVLRLLTLNASHGRSTSMNQMFVSTKKHYQNLDQIATFLDAADAHVVALQEADAPSRWSGKFDHVDYLREQTTYECSVIGEHADSWLYSFGTALLSRVSIKDSESVSFPASPPTTTKGFVRTTINWDVGGQRLPVTIVSVHMDFSRKSVRDKQTDVMIEELQGIDSPLIVMGDLNSYWEQKRSHVRRLAEALELSAYEPLDESLGTYKSVKGKRLDWILASHKLEFSRYDVLPGKLSDHLAVYAEIRYRN
ncbi:MAG: endonuclease/exonuclease/phosphatase family protein, partial [Gammaproteobacteria bacterium]